ncbi:unnamed protein product [Anisakis simplex]|uniref:Conserved plasma membrane protein n=1 Tax=Anisakis simplex TaxID=6269 RepID=A0A0M3J8B9_ANISI|nr:unnamed protein product [Anisakis simplex]
MSAERRRSLRSHSNDRNRRQSFDAPLSNQFESDYQSMPDHPSFDSGVRHRNRLYPELDQSIEGSFNTADEGDISHSDVDGNDKEYGMGGECGDDNDDELLEGEEYSRILPRSRSNSNLSYSPETGYDKVVIFSLTVLIIVMALIWFLKGGNELHQAFDQRNQAFDRYKNETGRLLKKNYPGTDVKARDILRLMGEKLIIKGEVGGLAYCVYLVRF